MPHAPFLSVCIEERLLPFAKSSLEDVWTAFPSPDYYGSSVTIADIQSRFSHSTYSPDRRSALGNPRLKLQ